jgi:hypothetical protein
VLLAQCVVCHGERLQQGGLRLDTRAALLKGGASGPSVVPGKPSESLLLESVRYHTARKMPPKGKLPDAQIAALTQWVQMGAPWPEAVAAPKPEGPFWAFQPVRKLAPPRVKNPAWVRSPIDAFILAGLESKGLTPAPPADRRTLIRRATYDLIGLPPTPAEVAAFLADPAPNAFAKVVDRLLASPRYGEKWGRHWLDVARYADSNGLDENLAYAYAYRYRDYVIQAFNRDLPYDQFIHEQLAGDLLPPSPDPAVNNERRVATGLLSLGPKMLAEDDPVKMEMDIIDEQVDTVGRAFMGLTLGCARCHDHKFDPLSTADYYALAGIFKSTKTMENFNVVAQWNEFPLISAEEKQKLEAHEAALKVKREELEKRRHVARDELVAAARERAGDYLRAAASVVATGSAEVMLQPALGKDGKTERKAARVLEAESFVRGNVGRDMETYGQGIGVLINTGALPNFAEWEVEVAEAGPYQLDYRLAAQDSRPVRLSVNGRLAHGRAASETTGSWTPESQSWFSAGVVLLRSGKNVLRIERDEPIPHFDKLALTSWSAIAGNAPAPSTPELVAAERGLIPELVSRWVEAVRAARQKADSPLRTLADAPGNADEVERLATRLGLAEREWRALRAKDPVAVELPDAGLAAVRGLLYGAEGPFGVRVTEVEQSFPPAAAEAVAALKGDLDKLTKERPTPPMAMGVQEGKTTDLQICIRGSHLTLGDMTARRFPTILAGTSQTPFPATSSGRLELAKWLASPTHPLTGRVMVNRVWQGHFGRGLVRSPDNFGKLGDRPTNPALLDWLAATFTAPRAVNGNPMAGSGWSLKALHRLIMLSNTYQMSTAPNPRAALIDPENRLNWRMDRRRLTAEEIRDSILSVSGSLDVTMGGSLLQTKNRDYVTSTANINYSAYEAPRRSVYLPVVRSALYDVFQAFDFADPSTLNGERSVTTVAPQALFMMNSDLMLRETRRMAEGLLKESALDDAGRVRAAYARCYGRSATEAEALRALGFVRRYTTLLAEKGVDTAQRAPRAWGALCRVLIAANEFVYVE